MDTQTYPERVTLCEDGQYRWSYILSREQSRFYYRHMLKICSIIAAVITVIALVLLVTEVWDIAFLLRYRPEQAGRVLTNRLREDGGLLWLLLLPAVGVVGLPALLGHFMMNGGERYRFEMDGEYIRHKNASKGGDTWIRFDRITDMRTDGDILLLKTKYTTYRVYVPTEDIAFVTQYIKERN